MKTGKIKKKKTERSLVLLYCLAGLVLLALISATVLWFNNELPKLFQWHFTF